MDALLIFAKWPQPGRVKTRLTPTLSSEVAASLYRCMLMDTLAATSGLPGVARVIVYDAEEERDAEFRSMAPDAGLFRQQGQDLGERLTNAFCMAFSAGFRSVLAIGTDSPHMPVERVDTALSLMHGGDVDIVLGPSEDGGYYLIGMKELHRELFRDIPWSGPEALKTSVSRAQSAGLRVALLTAGFDLDTVDELRRLGTIEDEGLAALTRGLAKRLGY